MAFLKENVIEAFDEAIRQTNTHWKEMGIIVLNVIIWNDVIY